mmetsp:Transcript_102180/g.234143  ORF Transcript_102180/g.234143 Transcript_102180/m.234143 type:complete len:252 (-) Transcript_102180:47-802(-)
MPGCGGGTLRTPLVAPQSGACSQVILHLGCGQSLGLLQCHSHWGSGHTVLHPMFTSRGHCRAHFGFSHFVVHFGVWQSSVFFPSQGSFGQNIAQLGSPHCTLHPFTQSPAAAALGHRVSHWGTEHFGSQSCSQTGSVHFQAQWGTQLFRFSSGTMVGIVPLGTCSAPVATAPAGNFRTLTPCTGLYQYICSPSGCTGTHTPATASDASAPPSAPKSTTEDRRLRTAEAEQRKAEATQSCMLTGTWEGWVGF